MAESGDALAEVARRNGVLFGRFQKHADKRASWKDRLHRKASFKALNIPDDQDEMIYSKQTGIGALGAAGIALAAGLPAAALAAYMMFKIPSAPAPAAPTQPEPVQPAPVQQALPVIGDDVTRELQKDGTLKEIGRRKARVWPGGKKEYLQPDGTWSEAVP